MIRRIGLLALLCFLLVMLSPRPAMAGSGPAVLNSAAEASFPASLTFKLSASSDANIVDIRLHYRVDRMTYADVASEVYIDFAPAMKVDARWSWDMRKTGGLPPGATLEYWWTVTDAGGNRIETQPAKLQFDDSRYAWHSLTQGNVTLHWYQGDESFGMVLLTAAQAALSRLAGSNGANLERPVKIFIYANSKDLQGSMIFPQEWTGGVSFSEYGTIAIGIAPNQMDWGIRTISHEFTHMVIHQVTFNAYSGLPTWLNEGLAMYNEGSLQPQYASLLRSAITQNRLISVRSLSSPFSAFAQEASLAYAQSYSVVKFLIDTYGEAKLFDLLAIFRQGSGYDEALLKVYQFDTDGLNDLWRKDAMSEAQPGRKTVWSREPALSAAGVGG